MDNLDKIIKDRKEQKRTRSNFEKVIQILSVAIIIVSVYVIINRMILFVKNRNFYSVNKIQVIGLDTFTKDDILALADLNTKRSIFSLDIGAIAEKIKSHPRIRNAMVYKDLPDRVVIRIVEKTETALILSDGKLYSVDSEGFVLAKENFIRNYDLPIITGLEYAELFPGNRVGNEVLYNILKVLYDAGNYGFAVKKIISEIHVRSEVKILYTIYTDRNGIKVFLGTEFSVEKLRRLEAAYGYFEKHNLIVKQLDLRYKNATYKEI